MTRMPAEWEPHAATWLAWPHRKSDWPGKFRPVPWVYTEIVRRLHTGERVRIEVQDADAQADAAERLARAGVDLSKIDFHAIPTDRCWTRDHGPTFVRDAAGKKTLLDWHFNAWAKYDDWHLDDAVPGHIAEIYNLPIVRPHWKARRVVLEGGAIDVNGAGLLLTTEECLLSGVQQRNPGMGRADYEAVFAEHLGVEKVLWLADGVAGDDTHGHIDDLARFVSADTIVLALEDDPADANFRPTQENLERLQGMTDAAGRKLQVLTLPMPDPLFFEGQRLPASYANFYVGNEVVLVPTFNDPKDRIALGTLAELFPDREVIGIHSVDLVWGLGTLHCMTQQEPV